jgi:hypothetical protein
MRQGVSRGLIVVALAAGSLLAAPLAGPASAAAPPATCNSPKSVVNIKKSTATFTLTACTNPKATGGSGSAVVNFKKLGTGSSVAGTITWHGTGTTTFSLSTKAGKTPNKCAKGTLEFISSGKVLGGSGAALKGIPKGSPVSETTCSNATTGASSIYPGTKFVV